MEEIDIINEQKRLTSEREAFTAEVAQTRKELAEQAEIIRQGFEDLNKERSRDRELVLSELRELTAEQLLSEIKNNDLPS